MPLKCCKTRVLQVHKDAGRRGRPPPGPRDAAPPLFGRFMEPVGGKAGLVLAGGGARAAYQVGARQAIKENLPHPKIKPFQIICGTPPGAVKAGALAPYSAA